MHPGPFVEIMRIVYVFITLKQKGTEMLLNTILNHVQKFKGFVFKKVQWANPEKTEIDVLVEARANSQPRCSQCGRKGLRHGRQPVRRFAYLPLWGIPVMLVYAPRRVECSWCGVRVESLPWTLPENPKSPLTEMYAWYLARWAKRLSWSETAEAFKTTWDMVYQAVSMAVRWGLSHRDLSGIGSIGTDEIALRKGHSYITLVYQIDEHCKRLLWIGKERTIESFQGFFDWFGAEKSRALRFIASDMWGPFVKVIAQRAPQALHILDRFHIMAHIGKAIDEIRAEEVRTLKAKGKQPLLSRSKWILLKRPENLTPNQEIRLGELLRHNLKAVRAYILKEDFQSFWEYVSPAWAEKFLNRWITRVLRSRLEPMKKVARMLRNHQPLILNWFRAKGQVSSGTVEGFNTKAKLTARKSYGFRTFKVQEIALYHTLGALPVPEWTNKFS